MKNENIMKHEYFEVADKMAQQLVRDDTDPNEVSTALEYLVAHQDGKRFLEFLETVVKNGFAVVRSNRTIDYYRSISRICEHYLTDYQDKPELMSQVLGWAIRLMRFYRVAPKYIESKESVEETAPSQALSDLKAGMVIEGTVKAIKPFGAFVDIGVGRDGLVHISELSHGWVENVSDIVNPGDEVKVKVLKVDLKRKRISLSMKDMA